METITGAEACRRHGARRRNHTPRDSSRTYHLHRQVIARYGAGLAGRVAKVTPKTTTSPSSSLPMSFSDALNKTKAAAEPENAREVDATPYTDDDDVPAAQNGGG